MGGRRAGREKRKTEGERGKGNLLSEGLILR